MASRRKESPALRKAIEKHKRAAYQEGILQAAAVVFSRLGFADAKMSDLAAEAGVSVGTLYNYFDSKDAVIASLVSHEHAVYRSCIESLEEIEDPLERIRRAIEESYKFLEVRGALLTMAVGAGLFQRHIDDEKPDEIDGHLYVRNLYERAFAQAAEAGQIRKDLSPARLALALQGVASTLVFEWVRTDREQPLAPQVAFVFDLFMKGARPR